MILAVVGVAGGLAMFLYGLELVSDGLKGAAGNAMRVILHRITATKAVGFLVGGLATFLFQSSIVTTVVLVGLAGAGMVTFAQTLPVILGANVGATLTVQLVVFKVADYSLLAIFIGYLIQARASTKRMRYVGDVVMGFGLLFYGMHVMTIAVEPVQEHEGVKAALVAMGQSPFWAMVAGTLFTAVVRSSAAAIGFIITLAAQGMVELSGAIPFVLGANIGTCVSAVLASFGGSVAAKRVAAGHVFFKVAGVALMWPFLGPFEEMAVATAQGVARQIANAHTAFNIFLAVAFIPLSQYVARIIEWMLPEKPLSPEEALEQPVFLDRDTVASAPSLAIDQAERETLRLAGIVQSMVEAIGPVIARDDLSKMEEALRKERAVDRLFLAITTHLTDISEGELEREEAQKVFRMLYVVNDLEHIGDLVVGVLHGQRKRIEEGLQFSDDGKREIISIHQGVAALLKEAVTAFEEENPVRARGVLASLPYFFGLEQRSRLAHLGRLQAGVHISRQTSGIHLDVINALVGIAQHAAGVAQVVVRPDFFTSLADVNPPFGREKSETDEDRAAMGAAAP